MAGNVVEEEFVAIAGIFATAPLATPGIAPTDAGGALSVSFVDHGLITAAGITRSEPTTSTPRYAWQNNTRLRTLVTQAAVRWQTILVQASLENIELFNGADVVNGAMVIDPSKEWPHLQLDVDLIDKDGRIHREYAPDVQIVERGDQVALAGDGYGWPVTLEAQFNEALGGYTKQFFSEFENIAVATITTALPTAMGVDGLVELIGTGFASTSAVTVGGVAATFDYISPTKLHVHVPAGSAGSAPIIVTNDGGASSAKAYTRT